MTSSHSFFQHPVILVRGFQNERDASHPSPSLLQHPALLESGFRGARNVHLSSLSSFDTPTLSSTYTSSNNYHLTHQSQSSYNSLLPHPVLLERSISTSERSISNTYYHSVTQPHSNPHQQFLNRSEETCPPELTGSKRTRWLKAGKKAQLNQELLSKLPNFQWPVEFYGTPIHLHYNTPESVVLFLIQRLQNIKVYVIDTESDKPTKQHPKGLPSLIQVQAIVNQTSSTVLLIEVQHLPYRNTSLFNLIKTLCSLIFSCNNTIMGWGEITEELKSFQHFHLFDHSQIINTFNIQKGFLHQWNQQHPHTVECLQHTSSNLPDISSEDYLICCVNSDDLMDDSSNHDKYNDDHHLCKCPNSNRPYKMKDPMWALQTAIKYSFNEALDKSMTMNTWSCGLDIHLKTWQFFEDQCTRENLISYAMNDLFASTKLFFHFDLSTFSNHFTSFLPSLNLIKQQPSTTFPLYFVLSDSHSTFVPPLITTSSYQIVVKSISGLKWFDAKQRHLSALSLITTPPYASYFTAATKVLFLIGTNSVRLFNTSELLSQVEQFLTILRTNHAQFSNTNNTHMVACFPCRKLSNHFSSYSSLEANISSYNRELIRLSNLLHFNVIDFHVSNHHLGIDNLHIDKPYRNLVSNSITTFFASLPTESPSSSTTKINRRSLEAIKKRNTTRHHKMAQIQKELVISRSIEQPWTLKNVKDFLHKQQIKHAKVPPVRNNKVRLQFNTISDLHQTDEALPIDTFSTENFYRCCFF
ncbi:unnamed protein product [Adineta steineri]|uniref:Uncharacterized protein n=1 Tax=Adineta steineri TaxID=433720 RepID=A0A815SPL0_9BILA|nr:unnamed protein product [Adineta steineri]